MTDPAAGEAIRSAKGNAFCADCDAPSKNTNKFILGAKPIYVQQYII